jgi:hypothetical protein
LGVLAYETLTRREPFAVPPVLVMRAGQILPEPAPPDGLRSHVAEVILACMNVEPRQRPSAKDVAAALETPSGDGLSTAR